MQNYAQIHCTKIYEAFSQRRRLALLSVECPIGAAHDRLAVLVRRVRVVALSKRDGWRWWEGVVLHGRVGARTVGQLGQTAPARVARIELGQHVR